MTDIFTSALKDSGFGEVSQENTEEQAESFTIKDGVAFVDSLIGEENKELANFWGAFKNGFVNEGSNRKGARD